MNSKKLSELIVQGKSVDEVIEVIKSEEKRDSEYDISEDGINSFGYNLMEQSKNKEALKIFKLNTELYPDRFNTWDSYGECLLILGEKEEGIKAYKKSLELNPKNKNAETIIQQSQ